MLRLVCIRGKDALDTGGAALRGGGVHALCCKNFLALTVAEKNYNRQSKICSTGRKDVIDSQTLEKRLNQMLIFKNLSGPFDSLLGALSNLLQ
jgi:hypothetical protein